jgi:hypothetical protein
MAIEMMIAGAVVAIIVLLAIWWYVSGIGFERGLRKQQVALNQSVDVGCIASLSQQVETLETRDKKAWEATRKALPEGVHWFSRNWYVVLGDSTRPLQGQSAEDIARTVECYERKLLATKRSDLYFAKISAASLRHPESISLCPLTGTSMWDGSKDVCTLALVSEVHDLDYPMMTPGRDFLFFLWLTVYSQDGLLCWELCGSQCEQGGLGPAQPNKLLTQRPVQQLVSLVAKAWDEALMEERMVKEPTGLANPREVQSRIDAQSREMYAATSEKGKTVPAKATGTSSDLADIQALIDGS